MNTLTSYIQQYYVHNDLMICQHILIHISYLIPSTKKKNSNNNNFLHILSNLSCRGLTIFFFLLFLLENFTISLPQNYLCLYIHIQHIK